MSFRPSLCMSAQHDVGHRLCRRRVRCKLPSSVQPPVVRGQSTDSADGCEYSERPIVIVNDHRILEKVRIAVRDPQLVEEVRQPSRCGTIDEVTSRMLDSRPPWWRRMVSLLVALSGRCGRRSAARLERDDARHDDWNARHLRHRTHSFMCSSNESGNAAGASGNVAHARRCWYLRRSLRSLDTGLESRLFSLVCSKSWRSAGPRVALSRSHSR